MKVERTVEKKGVKLNITINTIKNISNVTKDKINLYLKDIPLLFINF